jgi:hypothetical protein
VTWLTPITGVILAAAIVPPLILLYFLKLRRRPQPIACTLLWKKAIEDLRANAPFQRLRRSLLLLLQLLAIGLLSFSVMQPQLHAGGRKGGRTILLFDNSSSMTATDVEDAATRLDDAKKRGRERIEALYSGGLFSSGAGETMIITFADAATIASRFSSSKQDLLAAIDRIAPTHGDTRIDEALKLARAYTTEVNPDDPSETIGPPATLEVFSDGRIQDLGDQVLRGESMVYHRVGTEAADNVAVGAIDVARPYDRPTSIEVFAALLNFNRTSVTCDVQLAVDATARAVEEITLPPAEIDASSGALLPGRKSLVFTPFDQPRGAIIEVANLRPDHLEADNAARTVVPPPKRLSVALVPETSYFVRKALEGMALERLELLTIATYESLAEHGGLDAYDVIVFEGVAPPEGKMPAGHYLTFGPTPPVAGLNPFGADAQQIVLDARDDHPLLRFANLDALVVPRSTLLKPSEDVQVIVEGSAGPLIVAVSRGTLQLVHVTFEPGTSNWPLLRSWVTFLFNAVEHLGHLGEGLTERGPSIGEAITARLPSTATDIVLTLPDGAREPVGVTDPALFAWGPIRRAGVYLLSWQVPGAASDDAPRVRAYAVNPDAEREGDIASLEQVTIGQERVSGVAADAAGYTPLWPWAVGFCLAVLMLEWWVYHRKVWV